MSPLYGISLLFSNFHGCTSVIDVEMDRPHCGNLCCNSRHCQCI